MTVDLPEPYATALRTGEPRSVADAPASAPAEHYARAMARIQVGREAEARADLEAAAPSLGDLCRVEIAFLDIKERAALREALSTAADLASRAPKGTFLEARVGHLQGLALGKLRETMESTEALVRAGEVYRALGERLRLAEVHDTLGMLYAAEGQLEPAVGYYALSIVQKVLSGDVYGAAITLGNLGRLHLRAGRPAEALACFDLDRQMASRIGDERGRGRMLNDLARARLESRDCEGALRDLRECLEVARRNGFADLEFFARKDLAHLAISRFREEGGPERLLEEADRELALAEGILGRGGEPYLKHLAVEVRGELLLARGDERAVEVLEQAARSFAAAALPDLEIPTLLRLAEALARRGHKESAERCLVRALGRARRDGYARYLPTIRQAMARLDLVEGMAEERGRLAIGRGSGADPGGYTRLRFVGGGGFGDVYRALDPLRNRIVALKILRLEHLYDVEKRRRILDSIRLELEAASRSTHPGIARVYAVGIDAEDRTYVVQEFVEGRSLRAVLESLRERGPGGGAGRADPREVLAIGEKLASALVELHSRGIVHRDLKPENILLRDGTGEPVLVDFGIAHVPTLPDPFARRVVGTLSYMPPEQARGERVDGRADVYALGCVLYEWLAGARPLLLPAGDHEAVLRLILTRKPPLLREHRPDLPGALESLLRDTMAKARRKRPTAAVLVEELGRIRESLAGWEDRPTGGLDSRSTEEVARS